MLYSALGFLLLTFTLPSPSLSLISTNFIFHCYKTMSQLRTPVNSNDHILGNENAPLELVEYGDYECPHCGRAYPIVKDISRQLGDQLKFVFRNFPLSNSHPHAVSAAVATEAAALQGKYWEMHDIVFENQKTLEVEHLFLLAHKIGLDLERFKNDIQDQTLADKVEKDFYGGLRSGVNRTPTFFINGQKYDGDWSGNNLLNYLQTVLAEASTSPTDTHQ